MAMFTIFMSHTSNILVGGHKYTMLSFPMYFVSCITLSIQLIFTRYYYNILMIIVIILHAYSQKTNVNVIEGALGISAEEGY